MDNHNHQHTPVVLDTELAAIAEEACPSCHPSGGEHTGEHHAHDHPESLRRLKSAEGHLRGIQRMLEEDVYCIDIIRQIQAVQAALNKVSVHILNQHLNTCVITAVRGEDPGERERILKEIAEVYDMATKV